MEIINLTENLYKQWDNFCLESDDAWFWHTSSWLKYILNYKPELRPVSKSFMVSKNKNIIAICPLILETNNGVKEFGYGGDYGQVPVFANFLTLKEKQKVEKFVFSQVDKLAIENEVKRASFRFPILSKSNLCGECQRFNYLMKFGYIDNTINTQVLDLKKPLDELRREVRHGHDSDIDRASKALRAEIFDQNNITDEIFEIYVDLHRIAAGRITRPKATFDLMYEFIKNGNGFLVGAKKNNEFVGFAFFSLFKGNVYYSSSANNHDVEKAIPISHFIQWNAIEYMKKKDCGFYESGWQKYSPTLANFCEVKEINISKFQRGFGGYTLPFFRGEKFYDKNYFLKIYNKRINQLAVSIDK